MASLTQTTWVWANLRSWWWTGKPGGLQSMGLQRVERDWTTEQQQQTYLRSEASKRYLLLPLHFNIVLEILVASGIEETKLSLLVNGIRFKKIIYLFIYWLCLGLLCCMQAFFRWGKFSSCGVWAHQCGGFSCCQAQVLEQRASAVVAHGLSCHTMHGVFPDQGNWTWVPCIHRWILNHWTNSKVPKIFKFRS